MLKLMSGIRAIVTMIMVIFATGAVAQDATFAVDDLNAGLSEPPQDLDRSSPQGTVEAFLDRGAVSDFATVAHLLNLADIPVADQATRGPQLAEKLYAVVDRKIVINWANLLDRPDALDANATNKSAVAGEIRRSILLSVLTIGDRPYPIRLDRVAPENADPVWVFSERSVANIDRLYDIYSPSDIELMLPAWARGDAFWNLMWWEVIGVPIMLLLAGLGGLIARRVLSGLADRTDSTLMTRIVKASRFPVILFTITAITAVISRIFVFSGPVAALLSPAIALGFVMSALIFVVNVIDQIIDRLVVLDDADLKQIGADERRATATKVSLARRMLIVLIVLIGSGVVLASADVAHTFGFSLLASAGALTLVLGFAAREVLSNIMSSMQIALNQSARIGDKVVYNGQICNVERINFTYVLLRVWTGVRLVVPVTEFVSETFENWTIKEPQMTRLIDVRVSHAAKIATLRDLFFEVIKDVDQDEVGDADNHKVMVTSHDVFGQTVTFCLSCANPNTSWALSCEVREALIDRMQDLEGDDLSLFPDVNPAEGV